MAVLRAEAYKRGESHQSISTLLGVSGKDLSYWCSHSPSSREPPLWAIRRLASHLGYALVLLPDEVLLADIADARDLALAG